MIITFHGTFAHENEISGTHDQGLITGSAFASVFRFDDSYMATANCSANAYYADTADRYISGSYNLKVHVGRRDNVKPPKESSNMFRGNVYDSIFDGIGQGTSETDLAAKSNGGGSCALYLIMEIEGEERHIPLYHVHQHSIWEGVPNNQWEDSAP